MKAFVRSLIEFSKYLIPWLIFIVFDLVGWQVDIPFLPFLSDIPDSVYVLISFSLLLLGSAYAYHHVRIERDRFRDTLDRRDLIEKILAGLKDLRKEGVALRHQGATLTTKNEKDDWKNAVTNWRERVISELANLSPTEVGLFDTLDYFEAPPFDSVQDFEIRHEMQMLFAETHRLMTASLRWQGYVIQTETQLI